MENSLYNFWKTQSKLPNSIEMLGRKIDNDKEIVDAFNNYFSNIGASVGRKVQASLVINMLQIIWILEYMNQPFSHQLMSLK